MKSLLLALGLVVVSAGAHGQGTFGAGDVYTYQFIHPPSIGSLQPASPMGGYSANFDPNTVDATVAVRLEMFENSLAEAPVGSIDCTNLATPSVEANNAWQDRQGVLRITMLTGSATLNSIDLWVRVPEFSNPFRSTIYGETVIPVPEPGLPSLVALGGLGLFAWRRLRLHHGQPRALNLWPIPQQGSVASRRQKWRLLL
jgi:hypothetical protein